MKKTALLICLPVLALMLTFCNKDSNGPYTKTYTSSLINPTLSEMQEFYDGGFNGIEGSLELDEMGGLNNMNYFSNLQYIYGDLVIRNNADLESLEGLNKLQTVSGDVILSGNSSLLQVSYLGFLRSVGRDLVISANDNLFLIELQSLNKIEGALIIEANDQLQQHLSFDHLEEVLGSITIRNGSFTDMGGFSQLQRIEGKLSLDQSLLTTLSGLESLQLVRGGLTILDNSKLKNFCGIRPVLEHNGISGSIVIQGNAYNPTPTQIAGGSCNQ